MAGLGWAAATVVLMTCLLFAAQTEKGPDYSAMAEHDSRCKTTPENCMAKSVVKVYE